MCQKTAKKKAMIEQMAIKYHPDFIKDASAAKRLMRYFEVTQIFEEALAHIGNIDFIDAGHHDFSDGTEAKTASVTESKSHGKISTTYFNGAVTNVTTPAGIPKSGDIRLGVFNQYHSRMDYFYLPHHVWTSVYTQGGPDTKYTSGKIPIAYNAIRDEYSFAKKDARYNMDLFRCESFEDLAITTPQWAMKNMGASYGLYLAPVTSRSRIQKLQNQIDKSFIWA